MRERLFEIIEIGKSNDKVSHIYDVSMMIVIVTSIVPLAFKAQRPWMDMIDIVAVIIFAVDYLFRWFTADLKYGSKIGFLKYPFSPSAIFDMLAILPSVTMLNSSFRLFKVFRLSRSIRILRVIKAARYSKSIAIIINVFKAQKETLVTIGGIAFTYILVSALVILNVEPDTFESYFDAVYWAVVSLTTVGYGDIYPVTTIGKIITMFSSIFGIAVVALPAGVITAGIMEEINKNE